MPGPVRAPSDLARGRDEDDIEVGGRAIVSAERVLVADAFRTIPTSGLVPEDVVDGALVQLSGAWRAGVLEVRAHRIAGPEPTSTTSHRDVTRLRDRGVAGNLVARARALGAVRRHFDAAGFVEVETPYMVPCPGLDLHLAAFEARGGDERYLITSPEYQMKRLLVGGVPRCFQFARCFRRGERGRHHNPEFLMLEWYRAFAPAEAIIEDTQAIVRVVVHALAGGPRVRAGGREVDVDLPWERVTVAEAFARWAKTDESTMLGWSVDDTERFFRVWVEDVEPALAAHAAPVVVERFPASMASLARLVPDDPRYAERFEVYLGGMELSNGFGELTDPVEQRARFERDRAERRAQGLDVYPLDERFLEALGAGMPPSSGNALGFDRLVALGLGCASIHDVIAFPADELDP